MPVLRRTALAAVLAGAGLLSACGPDEGARGVDAYCKELAEDALLLNLDMVAIDEIDALVDRYQHLADIAPLAIEEQWTQLTSLARAAAIVDLTNEESRAAVVEQAASTERAATQIADHAAANCGITLLMGTPPPATTTTVAPPPTQPTESTTLPPDPATTPAIPPPTAPPST